jgi:hypothetical protein
MLSPVEGTKWVRGSVLVMLEVQSYPQLAAVLSELSMEVARNSDLTPDEVFRRLASLPRETVMDEASRLVEA